MPRAAVGLWVGCRGEEEPLSSALQVRALQVKVSVRFPGGVAQEAVRNMGPSSGARAKDTVTSGLRGWLEPTTIQGRRCV